MIVERRDIVHFERVMEFLSITHTLLPHLVTPIKHMKIMFGLKTLVSTGAMLRNMSYVYL